MNKLVAIPFGLAGMGIGMGIIGESLGSQGLQQGGIVAVSFIKPAVNIFAGGMVIGMLRDFNKRL